eukprot:1176036-Prorocentrum_minimum.AAC.2
MISGAGVRLVGGVEVASSHLRSGCHRRTTRRDRRESRPRTPPARISGNIQGTFRNMQGTCREHAGNMQGAFGELSGNFQGTFRESVIRTCEASSNSWNLP